MTPMTAAKLDEFAMGFDVNAVRRDFPILHQQINGHDLVYLDNGASTQKPKAVIDAIANLYSHDYSNVHRGIHTLSQRSTDLFEEARETVKRFLNAGSLEEVIFTSGTTDSINLVAQSYARSFLQAGDEVLVSAMEHHSNIVPWQLLAEQIGVVVKVIPINDAGEIELATYSELLTERVKVVAITHISNALGTINPLKEMIDAAHAVGAVTMVDGAQAVAHTPVDVQALGCDFYALSGHKLFAPTGIGVLFGKKELLDKMPPYRGGGDMIKVVSFSGTEYNELPFKFEAGTPNIAGAVGLAAAINYVQSIGLQAISQYEHELLLYATDQLTQIEGLRIIGTAANKASIISFLIDGVHASDLGTLLDHQGVAVRVGHHCAMPVMEVYGVDATTRASMAFYNTREEIDALVKAIKRAVLMLR